MTISNGSEYIEVITSTQKRRRWIAGEKTRIVQETLLPGMSVSYIARKYDFSASMLFSWGRRMQDGGIKALQSDEEVVSASEVRKHKG